MVENVTLIGDYCFGWLSDDELCRIYVLKRFP